MDSSNKKVKITIYIILIIILLLIIGVIVVFYPKNDKKKESINEIDYIKNYKVNEYIPVYISDSQMCSIYLNDYLYKMRRDTGLAYELLDDDYKQAKFSNIELFNNYIIDIISDNVVLKEYNVEKKGKFIYYTIRDSKNNMYIFKTQGVMQYKVFLDDNTVDIYSKEEL